MTRRVIRELVESVRESLQTLGAYTLLAGRVARETPRALWRFSLVIEQVYNAGALSLVIIDALRPVRRHGARPAGLRPARSGSAPRSRSASVAALGLLKELGPVITALLFAGRAGTALASETRPDARDRPARGDGDDGGRPGAARRRAAVPRRRDRDAAARRDLQRSSASLARSSSACRSWASMRAHSGRRCGGAVEFEDVMRRRC